MQRPRIRVRRPRLTYANVASTLALVLAMSMGGAYAHGKIGSAQIKQNAVKSRHIGFQQVKTPDLSKGAVSTNRIKAKAVTKGKLAPSARTKIIRYNVGAHDFSAGPELQVNLPAGVSLSEVRASTWSATMLTDSFRYQVPGHGWLNSSTYKIYVNESSRRVNITRSSGPGEAYEAIRLFQSVPTGTGSGFTLSRNAIPREQ